MLIDINPKSTFFSVFLFPINYNRMFKKVLIGVIFLALIGAAAVLYVWFKPHRMVEDAKGVPLTADSISKIYSSNEKKGDSLFLNKAIEVTGTIGEIDSNKDGRLLVILQTSDPM